jgi:pimeloyl-ACP methyl ester carboxylesterase
MDEGKVANGEVQLHYIAQGPEDGEPVLLLHGFPQYSYMWRNQLEALAKAGYRAIAADLRGYNLSDRPEGVENYHMRELLGDVKAFYSAFGWSKANLLVHDWGAIIGWTFAGYYPDLVKKLAVIDCPHPSAFSDVMLEGVEQMFKSWYIWFFQTPDIPEQYFGGANIERMIMWCFLSTPRARESFKPEDIQKYREMLLQPGQLTACFNYYRANLTPQNMLTDARKDPPKVQAPTLQIYGTDDLALASRAWKKSAKYCSGPFKSVTLEGVGHWAAEESPDEINRLVLEHFAEG